MSTTGGANKSLSRFFKGRVGGSGSVKKMTNFPRSKALSPVNPIPRHSLLLIRKDNSSQATTRRHRLRLCYHAISTFRLRNINLIPFHCVGAKEWRDIETEFPYSLGSANPCPNAVHMEPFSTSVYKVLICIFATTTKICTSVCFIRPYDLDFVTNTTPSYSSVHRICTDGCV
jgi:hypothetical protein